MLYITHVMTPNFWKHQRVKLRLEWIAMSETHAFLGKLLREHSPDDVRIMLPSEVIQQYISRIAPEVLTYEKVRSVFPVQGDIVLWVATGNESSPRMACIWVEECE